MKSLIAIMAVTLCAGIAQAVELSRATNQELVNELSSRLGTNSGGGSESGSVLAFCSGDTLRIELDGTLKSEKLSVFIPNGACATTIQKINHRLGSFSGVRLIAVCSGDTLNKYKFRSTGDMEKTADYIPSGQCSATADRINATN